MKFLVLSIIALTIAACTPASRQGDTNPEKPGLPLVKSTYKAGEIQRQCETSIANLKVNLDTIAATPNAERLDFDKTVMALETTLADFNDQVQPIIFMAYVSQDSKARDEASECEVQVGTLFVDINTRKDLYDAIKAAVPRDSDEQRLLSETLLGFEKNGLKLPEDKLTKVKALQTELTEKESAFSKNLNEDKSSVLFTKDELAGTSESFLNRLNKNPSGKYIVTTKNADYLQVMENATNPATRKTMLSAYLQRGGTANTELLNSAVELRKQIADVMGYETWADFRTKGRMAENSQNALGLLNGLKGKLAERTKQDIALLLESKRKSEDPNATAIEAWDVSYFVNQVKKEKFSLDDEEIRKYFPKDIVVAGTFQVYSTLFGVTFEEVKDAEVWHPTVKLYAIKYKNSDKIAGYFYADLFPREGKYGHAAAFTLIQGRNANSDTYNMPVSSMVSNFEPPALNRPSLLSHDEVETFFHEFGHIMHQTLTRAKYASLSGSSVARDYVEAPSQMLENWVWTPEILNMISGLYTDTSIKLPAQLVQKMLNAKNLNQGYFYSRQLVLGLTDLTIHTSKVAVDVDATYNQIYEEILGIKSLEGNHFMGTFGHMMGGYDAGYYGYIWSEVYAQDMWSLFKNDVLNEEMGLKYRKIILEQGAMRPALELIEELLGRPLSFDSFYEKLGIQAN